MRLPHQAPHLVDAGLGIERRLNDRSTVAVAALPGLELADGQQRNQIAKGLRLGFERHVGELQDEDRGLDQLAIGQGWSSDVDGVLHVFIFVGG